jgi:tripartite-type tricarboxylate transporter receptor subunit TctC
MNPHRRALLTAAAAAAALSLMPVPASAQTGEPIRIIFPFTAGGTGDLLSRLVADRMQAELKRPVLVENRTGGAGRIGVMAVRNAAPDGNTLLLTPIAPMAVYQHAYKALGYDPIADFAPVTQLGTFDFGLAVAKGNPATTLKELVEWAKTNPGQANFGSPAVGTLPHFLGVMLGRAAGIDLRHVPYKGSAGALAAVVGGHIPIIVTTTADLVQAHHDGRIRVLATSDAQRSPFLPDVPTFRESGYDLHATSWFGLFAPAKTPREIIDRYNAIAVAAVKSPEIAKKLRAAGLEPTGTSPDEFARIQKADAELWGPAVNAAGFKAD